MPRITDATAPGYERIPGDLIGKTLPPVGNKTVGSTVLNQAQATLRSVQSIAVLYPPVAITSEAVETSILVNSPYSFTFVADFPLPTNAWSVSSGTLPAGLTLDATTGVLSGTPTSTATNGFTISCAGYANSVATQVQSVAVVSAVAITSSAIAAPILVNSPYSFTFIATNSLPLGAWSVASGTLPAGLTLDSRTGVLSGTPTSVATSSFTVRCTGYGGSTATQAQSAQVVAAAVITSAALSASILVSTPFSFTFTATGKVGASPWSVSSGTLPTGLTLNASTGVLSGTPTVVATKAFTISCAGAANTASQAQSIPVVAAAVITSAARSGAILVNSPYSFTFAATGKVGTNPWSVSAGTLPTGLNLNTATGVLSGTPTTLATSGFTISCTGAANTATQVQSLKVAAPTVITSTNETETPVKNTYFTHQYTATGEGTITWAVWSGDLPQGLQLNPSTGLLWGVVQAVASQTFTVRASSAISSATQSKTISVQTDGNPALVEQIGTMTSASNANGTMTASTQASGFEAWRAGSRTIGTGWKSTSGVPAWIQFQFSTPRIAKAIGFRMASDYGGNAPRDFVFQGSNDGVNWTYVDARTHPDAWVANEAITWACSPQQYLYYRATINGNGGGPAVEISEFYIMG